MHMKGYMYILKCSDGSYYVGSTTNLELRLAQHQAGIGAKHTKKRLPVELVYYEEYARISDAFYREKQVQKWRREKKEALIRGAFDELRHLSKNYSQLALSKSLNAAKGTISKEDSTPVADLIKNTNTKITIDSAGIISKEELTPVADLVKNTNTKITIEPAGIISKEDPTPVADLVKNTNTKITIEPAGMISKENSTPVADLVKNTNTKITIEPAGIISNEELTPVADLVKNTNTKITIEPEGTISKEDPTPVADLIKNTNTKITIDSAGMISKENSTPVADLVKNTNTKITIEPAGTISKEDPTPVAELVEATGLEYYGNLDIINTQKIAFLCSRSLPASAVLKCYDWAIEQRENGKCVISGFHSQIEKDVLYYLLKGTQPIIIVLARGLKEKIEPELIKPFNQGRILIITPFNRKVKRVTEQTAEIRNKIIIGLADIITVGYAKEGGKLAELLKTTKKEIIRLY